MNITDNKTEIINCQPKGTCCRAMQIEISEGIIKNTEFLGGCDGNLKGLKALVKGMHIDEVIQKLQGITCGDKSTSCPDQLANFLIQYKSQKV